MTYRKTSTAYTSYAVSVAALASAGSSQGSVVPVGGFQRGVIVRAAYTFSLVTGLCEIQWFSDAARTIPVWSALIDMAAPIPDNLTRFFESEELTGELWYTITNHAASAIDVSITLTAESKDGFQAWGVPASVGAGLVLTVGVPSVDITTAFTFSGNKLTLRPDVAAAAYPVVGAGGVSITGAVATTGDQTIAGRKEFAALALTARGESGAPSSGTWQAGDLVRDADGLLWVCKTGGTPGSWNLLAPAEDDFGPEATSSITASTSTPVPLTLPTGQGDLLSFRMSALPASPVNGVFPMRLIIYDNSLYDENTRCGREYHALSRTSYLSSLVAQGSTTIPVNDYTQFEVGDLICIGGTHYYRVTAVAASLTIGEATAVEHAANSIVASVEELGPVPFWNHDGVDRTTAFLMLWNDHVSSAFSIVYSGRYRCQGGV